MLPIHPEAKYVLQCVLHPDGALVPMPMLATPHPLLTLHSRDYFRRFANRVLRAQADGDAALSSVLMVCLACSSLGNALPFMFAVHMDCSWHLTLHSHKAPGLALEPASWHYGHTTPSS